MRKLTIKNFGKIKDSVFDLNKINVIIGRIYSENDTVLKLLAQCKSYESHLIRNRDSHKHINMHFGDVLTNIYCLPKTYCECDMTYETDVINFNTENGIITSVDKHGVFIDDTALTYIPSCREVASMDIPLKEGDMTYISQYKRIWDQVVRQNCTDGVNIMGGIKYFHAENGKYKDYIVYDDDSVTSLNNAPLMLRTLAPLYAYMKYFTTPIQQEFFFIENPENNVPSSALPCLVYDMYSMIEHNMSSLSITTNHEYIISTLLEECFDYTNIFVAKYNEGTIMYRKLTPDDKKEIYSYGVDPILCADNYNSEP